MRVRFFPVAGFVLIFVASLFAQSVELRVVNAGPNGEMQELQQANEIRVVFSEPMVPLGRPASNVSPAWIRITPAIGGTFRWSGTTILLFTPDAASPLPYATRYRVTVDATAEAVSGRRLRAPFEFTFTTPTVRMTSLRSARRDGRFDSIVTLAMAFNQPVTPADILAHASVRYRPREFDVPVLGSQERARLAATDPAGLRNFDVKVADARRNAGRTDAVPVRLAPAGDTPKSASSNTSVVFQTTVAPPPGTSLEVVLDAQTPSPQGREVPGRAQSSVTRLPRAFFVIGANCSIECSPSGRHAVLMTENAPLTNFAAALTATDITDPTSERVVPRSQAVRPRPREASSSYSIEDAGFDRQPPARTWLLRVAPTLQSEDGQPLGYPWLGIIENWNERAFTSFGDGHGVWESASGPQLPYYSRNYQSITEHVVRLSPAELVPRLVMLEDKDFAMQPPGTGTVRKLAVTPNQIQSFGLNLEAAGGAARGFFWAGVDAGNPIARSNPVRRNTSTVVQVTNLGISVKDSPNSTLVFVTRLDTGDPVSDARISIVNTDNKTTWSGKTGRDGIALAPALPLRKPGNWYQFSFVVMAEKDGDVAYASSNWQEGIMPWDFSVNYDLWQATNILRASIFTDRGVYKPGEEVHVKTIARFDTPSGVKLLPAGSPLDIIVRDARSKEVDRRTVKVSNWSSVEWSWTVPASATLGNYRIEAVVPGSQPVEGNDVTDHEPNGSWMKRAGGGFLVAAYRRPDFQVATSLTTDRPLAGASLQAAVSATYLFGGTMSSRPAKWSLTRLGEPSAVPDAIFEHFPREEFTFGYFPERLQRDDTRVAGEDAVLNSAGKFARSFQTESDTDLAYRYTFEADVEDVSRQHIAGRSSVLVHPSSFYLGVKRRNAFANAGQATTFDIVAADLDGKPVSGITTTASVLRVQWNSVRRAEGGGFYTWETERVETPIGQWTVTTGDAPVPLSVTAAEGGQYLLRVTARDREGRRARTDLNIYVMGPGYSAWQRFDHNRIELEPEKRTWKPGETAKIMIKSPWERATALLTVEREGIRQHRRFTLTSTQQVVDVPITEADIPNVFVSVLLIRGRTSNDLDAEGNDPGKPAFRLGYTELAVADATKILAVKVTADRPEYRPANSAKVSVTVTDASGRPASSEVTLWAVDQGILALTDYAAPDVSRLIHVQKALQVMNSESRQRLISRRVLTPKGADEGGGGGSEGGPRTDFRPLAFWLGSVETDRQGRATRSVTLPDSLTTYRIMAVAGDKLSRFGSSAASLRVTKPITLLPAFPRFLALSDRASFGTLVGNTQATAASATVTMTSLTPSILEFGGSASTVLLLPPGATTVARFDAIARGVGTARVRVTANAGPNSDSFELTVAVGAPARMETSAAFGDTTDASHERLEVPAGVLPSAGGLNVELASSALVGLGEGARYLADYPYGCAEQKASAALALTLAADLGDAFSMGRIAPAQYRARAEQLLKDLPRYVCADGGFGYWPGGCQFGSFYLTSYVLHVMKVAEGLGIPADAAVTSRALDFLATQLALPAPVEVQWIPVWSASNAYAVKVLAEYGRPQDGNITRLVSNLDRLPIFALSYLADAMAVAPAKHPAYADVVRRLMNAVRVEGDRAHVEELQSDTLLWLWNSNVRSSAIVLDGIVRRGDDPRFVPGMVRSLLLARQGGRWRNTQENAGALLALVAYYRKFEAEPPNFTATVAIDGRAAGTATFRGRSSKMQLVQLAMPDLLRQVAAGASADLAISRAGTGRLYYAARLQYAPSTPLPASDQGIHLERRYERISENGTSGPASTTFAAGDLVRVTLTITLPKERRYVAVSDPLAAGFEAVDGWFKTTATDLAKDASAQSTDGSWLERWRRGGFDFVDKFDDRVELFATRLSEGRHEFSYVVRATTAGVFSAAGTWAEEMYAPEVTGRTAPATLTIK